MNKLFQFGLAFLLALTLLSPATSGYAATNTIQVTPTSTDWLFVDDNGVAGWTTGFESGPGTAPLGTGSVYIELSSAGAGIVYGTQKYQGTLLSSITALSYSTYTNLSPAAMAFQINYDPDLTTTESTWYGRLVYEPYVNGTVTNATWQTWDMINGGNGKWWASSNGNSTVDNACPQSTPCTWSALIAAFPNIGIRNDALSFIQFKAGSNWNGFAGNADSLSIGIGSDTDTYDFEPLSQIYVDDSWSAETPGTDPDGAGPALLYGTDSFDTIQEGIDAVTANGTVQVADGTYTEDLTIDKAVDLLGPNVSINPNTGTRVAEAIVYPATSDPDPNVCSVMAYLSTSDITIKGFTFDGDNPALTSGVTINGADVDACEILAGYEGMGNIVVENNILKHSTYAGIDFYNYTNSAATAGNYIRYNLLEDIGETTYNWGIGILVYNNFYADITDNVLNHVRTGIQTGNFEKANPGTTGRISNNVINTWRLGIFHNLWYSNASVISVDHNTISAVTYPGATRWNGVLLSSFQGTTNTIVADNIINIPAGVSFPAPGYTAGYNVWNTPTSAPLTISGGSVTGGDYGVFVNNYTGYNSPANNTSITVDNVTISGASLAGIFVQDDPRNTNNATVRATITNSPISNSAVGILIEGLDASATGSCNQIAGNNAGLNNTTSTLLNFEKNWWGAVTGPSGVGPGVGDSVSANVDFTPWSVDTSCASFTSNLAPVITEGASVSVTMSEDGSPTPFSLTLNATDPDAGDTLTWSISTPAAHGTASASGTGLSKTIGYTPNLNYKGSDSFVVEVFDGIASDSITVNVTILSDGADTTGVFRPSNGLLYLKNQNTTGFADVAINYGLGGDYPVVGDWDGNDTVTIGIYRNGTFYLRNSNTLGFADLVFAFGLPGDQPIAGDWNGDGVDSIGVYRPSTGLFLLRNSNDSGPAEMSFYLGNAGDVGIAGDWDGDGKDTTGVFRPSNGVIFLKNTNATGFADIALNYGLPGDKPVMGDWDDDGIDTIGIYRNGTFYLRNENTNGFATMIFALGNPGDMPIAGNWDGIP